MRILLIHPPAFFVSGGHRYNFALLEQARRKNLPLEGLCWQGSGLPDLSGVETVVWDSLFFTQLANLPLSCPPRHLLLCHYLPSLDPTLPSANRQAWRAIEDAVFRRLNGVIVTGPKLSAELRQRSLKIPVWLCEPGVEESFLAPCRQPKFLGHTLEWITVANLLPPKGYLEVLSVLAKFRRYPWRWHWVGSCPDRAYALRLRHKIRALGLNQRIVYHGEVPPSQLPELLDAADWFLFPSQFESFGMALQEAAARRLPILSTQVGAAERWVIPNRTGFLLQPGDWHGFARAIRRCLVTPKPKRAWQLGYASLSAPPTWEQAFYRWWEVVVRVTLHAQKLPN